MANTNTQKTTQEVIDKTKQSFSGPTPRQKRLQEEARQKGGLTERGIKKYYGIPTGGTYKTEEITKGAEKFEQIKQQSEARTKELAQKDMVPKKVTEVRKDIRTSTRKDIPRYTDPKSFESQKVTKKPTEMKQRYDKYRQLTTFNNKQSKISNKDKSFEKDVKKTMEREDRLYKLQEALGLKRDETKGAWTPKEFVKAGGRVAFGIASIPVIVGGRATLIGKGITRPDVRQQLKRAVPKVPSEVIKTFDIREPEGFITTALLFTGLRGARRSKLSLKGKLSKNKKGSLQDFYGRRGQRKKIVQTVTETESRIIEVTPQELKGGLKLSPERIKEITKKNPDEIFLELTDTRTPQEIIRGRELKRADKYDTKWRDKQRTFNEDVYDPWSGGNQWGIPQEKPIPQKLKVEVKVKNIKKPKIIQEQKQLIVPKVKGRLGILQEQKVQQSQKQKQEQKTEQKQRSKSKTSIIPLLNIQTSSTTDKDFNKININEPPTKPNIKIRKPKLQTKPTRKPKLKLPKDKIKVKSLKKIQDQSKQSYHGYVKQKGKFTKVTKFPRSCEAALGKVAKILSDYTERSGTIKRSSGKIKKSRALKQKWKQLQNQYRMSKINKNVIVEKSKYAIDSFNEKKGIPYKAARLRRAGLLKNRSTIL